MLVLRSLAFRNLKSSQQNRADEYKYGTYREIFETQGKDHGCLPCWCDLKLAYNADPLRRLHRYHVKFSALAMRAANSAAKGLIARRQKSFVQ